jgi:uncharacterized protein (TIGR03086 family)
VRPADGGGAVTLDRPLELVERALGYARSVLVAVPGHLATEPTPCPGWDLGELLAHVEDGFGAFVDGSGGQVLPPREDDGPRDPAAVARRLLDLGCSVLGGWLPAQHPDCRVGPAWVSSATVLEVAALEIALHGWDVAQVVAPRRALPPALASALLPLAYRHIRPGVRPGRFGPVLESAGRDPASVLLAYVGRAPARPA